MSQTAKPSTAFTFTAEVESDIKETARANSTLAVRREDNIIGLFARLGYDGGANIPGREWERIQHVYATAAADVTTRTVEHEKKAFRHIALALGYGKLQTAEAKARQDARQALKPAKVAKPATAAGTDTATGETGRATQAILAAILAIDNGNPAAARDLLVSLVPAKMLTSFLSTDKAA